MATIPQAIDYGARPSLRSSRVDVPGTGDLALADALSNAANNFAAVMAERKTKQDRLNYALAKNKILQADIEEREKLKGREDYENFDENYSTGFNTRRNEILATIANPHDAAILGSESELIGTRGRVATAEYGRTVMIDQAMADLNDDLNEAQRMMDTPTGNATRNDIMLTALDAIEGALEKGYFGNNGDIKAQALRENFVQKAATSSLDTMEPRLRELVLEASLANRKAGGPLTPDDIRAGKGTDSIADFLHTDTATKMLEATKTENKANQDYETVYAVTDKAKRLWPEADKASIASRNKYVREHLTGELRNLGQQEMGQINAEDIALDSLEEQEIEDALVEKIDAGDSYADLNEGEKSRLSVERKQKLKLYASQQQSNDGYAESNNEDLTYVWRRHYTDKIRRETYLNHIAWKTQLTRPTWDRMVAEQEVLIRAHNSGTAPPTYKGDTDDQMLMNYLLGGDFGFPDGKPSTGTPQFKRWARIDEAYDNALKDLSMQRAREGKDPSLNADDRRTIMYETLEDRVWLRRDPTGPNIWRSADPREGAGSTAYRTFAFEAELTEEQKAEAFLTIGEAKRDMIPDGLGGEISAEQWLRNQAESIGVEPSNKDIEEAYYWLKYGEGDSREKAKMRLLGVRGM